MQEKELTKLLFETYGTWDLTPKQVAALLNTSTQNLWRKRSRSEPPVFRKTGDASNAKISYPVNHLAEYLLTKDIIKTVA